MILVPDEGTVQELTAASPDPAFSDRVHPMRPDTAEHGPDADVGQDSAELDPIGLFAEVYEQVPGLLGGPLSCGMRRDAEDVGLGAVKQVNREKVASEDGPGLGAQELRPGWPGPVPGGIYAVDLED